MVGNIRTPSEWWWDKGFVKVTCDYAADHHSSMQPSATHNARVVLRFYNRVPNLCQNSLLYTGTTLQVSENETTKVG
jgi:hypothetical protein